MDADTEQCRFGGGWKFIVMLAVIPMLVWSLGECLGVASRDDRQEARIDALEATAEAMVTP